MYEYPCTVLSVVDGDTLHVELDLGLDVRHRTTVRLNGIDCPEHGTPEGSAATAYTGAWVAKHSPLTARTVKDKREKYGRYLAEIVDAYGIGLNDALVAAGHAKPYAGGKRG